MGIGYGVFIENAIGGTNIDTIIGNESDNTFYGGSKSSVKDTFVCSVNDTSTNLNLADIIPDFTNGVDKIGLEDKIVSKLSWADESSGTKIYETSTSKILFYLNSVSSNLIDESDFVQTDFV